jgi:hypothetical protein
MDEWQTVSVKGFGPLIDALGRAERKGYMPDAMAEEWTNFEFTRWELNSSDPALMDAYAEGRKDEREEVIRQLGEEINYAKGMARGNGGNPRYDYYVDALEMFLTSYRDEA